MYMSEEAMELLDGVIDLYLADFKYGNDQCAERLSKVGRYFEVVSRNHLIASKQADMIVRHLMLPGPRMRPADNGLAGENTPGWRSTSWTNITCASRPDIRVAVGEARSCAARSTLGQPEADLMPKLTSPALPLLRFVDGAPRWGRYYARPESAPPRS
jgi:hypothetical protein